MKSKTSTILPFLADGPDRSDRQESTVTPRNRGEGHHRAKLSDDDIRLIRQAQETRAMHIAEARKLSDKALAEKFGVSRATIGRVLYGEAWGHVK